MSIFRILEAEKSSLNSIDAVSALFFTLFRAAFPSRINALGGGFSAATNFRV